MARNTYSFKDVLAEIRGPNGSFPLGSDASPAEEGISIDMVDDKASMMIGAGGQGMHSLHASTAGTITFRLLKTSPTNALLSSMYNADTASSAGYGQNIITVRDIARGDSYTATGCGFRKLPPNAFSKSGNIMEWAFNCIAIDAILGNGQPSAV